MIHWGMMLVICLLQETVARLERFVDQAGGGTVARLGGDEFAFIVPGLGGLDGGLSDMPDLHSALCQPVQLGSRTIPSTVSMGLARVPADGDYSNGNLQECRPWRSTRPKRPVGTDGDVTTRFTGVALSGAKTLRKG
jgi:GGDEF domain-containing protein